MYLAHLKAAIVEALQAEFGPDYPYANFQNLRVGIEYPVERVDLPGLWVDYDDRNPVEIAGIGHTELIIEDDGSFGRTTRWTFEGDITITCVALSSLERDKLYDELVRIIGFSHDKSTLMRFRTKIENNDLVAMNINFDSLKPGGNAAAQGTPWGTSEVVYEKSISVEVRGEFIGDPDMQALVRLRKVPAEGYVPPSAEPAFTGDPADDHLMPEGYNPYSNEYPYADGRWR